MGSQRLQHVQGAQGVGLEIQTWVVDGSGHRHLPRQMEYQIGLDSLDELRDVVAVAHVAVAELEVALLPQPLQVAGRTQPAQVVEDAQVHALRKRMRCQVAAQKAAPTRDQQFHAGNSMSMVFFRPERSVWAGCQPSCCIRVMSARQNMASLAR